MPTVTDDRPLVDQLRGLKVEKCDELEAMRVARNEARAEKTDLATLATDEERTAYTTAYNEAEATFAVDFAAKEAEIKDLDTRIAQEATAEQRKAEAAAHSPRITVGKEPLTYRPDSRHSYWLDRTCIANSEFANLLRTTTPDQSRERLDRHAMEMDVEMPKRNAEKEKRTVAKLQELVKADFNPWGRRDFSAWDGLQYQEQRINPSTTQGQGGYFDPPLWLVEDYIPYLRAGRTAANLCTHMDVPPGVSSINIPRVTTPTLVAQQGANNVAVVSQDITDSAQATGIKTFAGQEDVAVQWLELSPGHITDRVVTEDLTAAYNLAINQSVIYGTGPSTGTSGGLLGLYPIGNWGSTGVTYTQGTPSASNGFFQSLGALASQVAQSRFNLENFHYLVHTRRGMWFVTALDGATSKPFVESAGFAPFQPGALEGLNVAEGEIARFPWGPSMYMDKSVPTTDASGVPGGGTADIAIGAKWDDIWLFESTPRTVVFNEVLSGTLQVRFQIRNYAGMVLRYGSSVAILTGTGMAAPTTGFGGNF